MKITKEQVLDNLEDVKKYIKEGEDKKEEKKVGIAIKTRLGSIIFKSSKTTIKKAIEEKSDANLRGADLSYADLSGANLRGADLSDADLSGANLSDADLSDANLSDADLSYADLSGANLSDADLSDADLSDADLSDANLSDANLRGAEMQNVKFYGKGGTKKLTKKQLPDFLNALGFQVE